MSNVLMLTNVMPPMGLASLDVTSAFFTIH